MPRLRPTAFAALLLSIAAPAGAVDLLQAYRDALASDPALKGADAARLATAETRPQAQAALLPNIGAALQQNRDYGVNAPAGTPSSYDSHTYGLTLTQPIYREDSFARLRQSGAIVSQADADYANAEQELIQRVATRYFAVLAAADNLRFSRAEKNAVGRELEQAKRRFDVGLTTIVDVHEAQARYDLTVSQEIAAENLLADTREALRAVTGQHYDELDELGERLPLEGPKPASADAWIDQALEQNPQVLSARFGVEAARDGVDIQRAGHLPTLDLVASRYDTDRGLGEAANTTGNRIGLQLNIPIFEGGAVNSRTRQAAHQHEAAKQQLEGVQREITRQVRDAYRGQQAAISQVKALRQALVSNRSSLEATRAGLEVGTRTIVDVLDAERELYRAERDYARARYDYVLNRLRLRQAAGHLSEVDLQEYNGWLQRPGRDSAQ